MKTPWEDIQAGTKEEIKKQVLELTLMDNPRPFIRHIIDLVGNLATSVMKDCMLFFEMYFLNYEFVY